MVSIEGSLFLAVEWTMALFVLYFINDASQPYHSYRDVAVRILLLAGLFGVVLLKIGHTLIIKSTLRKAKTKSVP